MLIAVVAVDERPDGARMLPLYEGEFFAIGLKQASGALAVVPAGGRVDMVRSQRELGGKRLLGEFNGRVGHSVILVQLK